MMAAVLAPESVERQLAHSLPGLLLQRAGELGGRVALRHNELSRWREYTWEEYATRTARIGLALRELGIEPGDRVAIHSENRPEWVMTDLAIQGIGAASVGIYPTSPSAEVAYLLDHSRAVLLVAEDEEQLDKVLAVRDELPHLRHIVVIETRGVRRHLDDPMIMTFADLEQLAADRPVSEWAEHVARLSVAGSNASIDRGDQRFELRRIGLCRFNLLLQDIQVKPCYAQIADNAQPLRLVLRLGGERL